MHDLPLAAAPSFGMHRALLASKPSTITRSKLYIAPGEPMQNPDCEASTAACAKNS